MGKSGDKQYQSASEHRRNASIRSGRHALTATNMGDRRRGGVPFGHCALTLRPYTQPVCYVNNPRVIYDAAALLPFVLQHARDPCTGAACTSAQLVTLRMDRNPDTVEDQDTGAWQCPILSKSFGAHSKMIAIVQPPDTAAGQRLTAYVYSYTAYKTLNVQAKNYTDLTTGEPFDPAKDVLVLQDPDDESQIPPLEQFYYITHADEFQDDKETKSSNIKHSATAKRILAQIEKKKEKTTTQSTSTLSKQSHDASKNHPSKSNTPVILAQDVTGVALTTAAGAASFTSTGMDLATSNTARLATAAEILDAQCRMLASLKTKGLVRLQFNENFGSLVMEIHADIVPRTAMNFLSLCSAGRYHQTTFHRIIPNFMMQGGKASTAKNSKKSTAETDEDASWWGEAFVDEFDNRLKHDARGVVAMANAGPHTNKQQFYITFAACPHLDSRHSVFGRIVQGMEVLNKVEQAYKDSQTNNGAPHTKVIIERTEVLVNPVETALAKETKRILKLQQARKASPATDKSAKSGESTEKDGIVSNVNDSGIGKYLDKKRMPKSSDTSVAKRKKLDLSATVGAASSRKQTPKKTTFGNFSGW